MITDHLIPYAAAAAAALMTALALWLTVIRRLHRLLSETEQASRQLDHELSALNGRHAQLQQQMTEAETEERRLRDTLADTHRRAAEAEAEARRLPGLEDELAGERRRQQAQQLEAQTLHGRLAAAEQQILHLQHTAAEYGRLKDDYTDLQQQLADSQLRGERLYTQIEQERQAQEEKIALLQEARQALGNQFQHLANEILEEKSRRFSEQNHEQIGRLLGPLNERISGFSQLVQNTYEKEAKERLTLENELKRLQQLNSQLHQDAKALTHALTGSQNKTQGNWGEMILESVLEHSGLQKGREYQVQSSGSRTEADGSIRRLQPDVLINLPDGKQIIIDAKVSLTAYVRYTRAADTAEAEQALAAHLQSVRSHVKSLSGKQYSDIEGLKTLDFVFLFIPVEPAYLLALQQDGNLFQECFDKRIMLTGPSTLLATLRTVANLWRNEQQNQNALAIAEEGGRLYDKFVGFVQTLEKVGKNIEQTQNEYQSAFKQLKDGRGNLITRAEKLHKLGIKAAKQLDRQLTESAAQSLPPPDREEE